MRSSPCNLPTAWPTSACAPCQLFDPHYSPVSAQTREIVPAACHGLHHYIGCQQLQSQFAHYLLYSDRTGLLSQSVGLVELLSADHLRLGQPLADQYIGLVA